MVKRRYYLYGIILVFVTVFLAFTEDAEAARRRQEYFKRPQIGAWFGPITPVGPTGDLVDTDLGFGLFFRYNLPFDLWKIGLDTSYQNYESDGVNDITLVPIIANVIFQIPLDLPLRFQLKAGVGTSYVYVLPDEHDQWDPAFMAGFEVSFPAGRLVNIGLRIDYLCIFEEHIEGAQQSGHFINTGIMLYFNL